MKVRKIHDKDWAFLGNWGSLDRDSLPQNGTGGFIVCATPDNTPIAALFVDIEEDTAIPAGFVSNKDYRDTDRSDALQLLKDFTVEIIEKMEYNNTKIKELWLGEQS